jgi:RNA polymerase sigma factor (TIGR02999 family)
MPGDSSANLSEILASASRGDLAAQDQFVEAVYQQLHKLAAHMLRGEKAVLTLQTTALVNESLLQLCGGRFMTANDERHFFNTAAQQMRRILIDRARARSAVKRDGVRLSLEDAGQIPLERPGELIALDDALKALAEIDAAAERVVELKYFGGYTDQETADILEINIARVRREWTYARAWLHDFLMQT